MADLVATPPAPAGALARASLIAADIKLAHSVFALPFALFASFLVGPAPDAAAAAWQRFAGKLVLVVLCMVFARTWAMLVNRLADREIDAQNDRTSRRVFASGRLNARTGFTAAFLSAALFIAAASLFWLLFSNPWPARLSIPVLGWIAFYSFTKRFTALCHIFLGGALAASPVAAAIAVNPSALPATPAVWWIAGFVLLWVAGFDVIYALQDREFDAARGLSSIPVRLGTQGALWCSRIFHAGSLAMLLAARASDPRLGALFTAGIVLVFFLLITEHAIVSLRGKAGLDMAFFTVNGIVSCVLGAAGCIDLLV